MIAPTMGGDETARMPTRLPPRAQAAKEPTPAPDQVVIEYLQLLLGGRNYEVLGRAMGMKDKAAGHLLNKRRKITVTHLAEMCRRWQIPASVMFDDLARIASNIERGLPPGDRLTLRVPPDLEAALTAASENQ